MVSQKVQQGLVLGMSTTAFTICFMVWMMFAVLGIPVKELLQLNETWLSGSCPRLARTSVRHGDVPSSSHAASHASQWPSSFWLVESA